MNLTLPGQLPTPCAAWNVRDLVNHVVAQARRVAPLLAGVTLNEVGEQLDGDLLGDDPVRAWDGAAPIRAGDADALRTLVQPCACSPERG